MARFDCHDKEIKSLLPEDNEGTLFSPEYPWKLPKLGVE